MASFAVLIMSALAMMSSSSGDLTAIRSLSAHDKIMAKLDAWTLPKLDLRNATLFEAVDALTHESKRLDPNHRGITFLILSTPSDPYEHYLTAHLMNVSLWQALHRTVAFSVGNKAVTVWHDRGEGISRVTFYAPKPFLGFPEHLLGGTRDVTRQLNAKGVIIAPGASATFDLDQDELVIVDLYDQIEEIDHLLYQNRLENPAAKP